jgi:predicted enzyme related to lactoylglutathione lyase
MPRVQHFEIPIDVPERAIKFYTEVFGWKINKWEGPLDYWLITTGKDDEPGIDGALTSRSERSLITNIINIPSIDEFVKKIEAGGGRILMPKTAVPGIGYMTYFEDTEGNVSGIMESDETAK